MRGQVCEATHWSRDGVARPRRAEDGSRLCAGCTARLGRQLDGLPGVDAAVLIGRTAGKAGKVSGSRERPIPVSDAKLDARWLIRDSLLQWTRHVCQERHVTPPAGTVPAMCGFLRRHTVWLADSDRAGEFADKVNDLYRAVHRVAYPSPPERTYIGECPYYVPAEDGYGQPAVCGQRVYAYPNRPQVVCDGCGASETVAEWQRVIVGRAGGHVTARTLVALLSARYMTPVEINTLYGWVHRGRVVPVSPGIFDFQSVVAYTDTVTRPVPA